MTLEIMSCTRVVPSLQQSDRRDEGCLCPQRVQSKTIVSDLSDGITEDQRDTQTRLAWQCPGASLNKTCRLDGQRLSQGNQNGLSLKHQGASALGGAPVSWEGPRVLGEPSLLVDLPSQGGKCV